MIDTPVSRSLAANFSEITGHPTPLELQVPITIAVALVIGTTETLPSTIASLEPPRIVTEIVVAPLPTAIASEPQGQATALASTSQLANLFTKTIE